MNYNTMDIIKVSDLLTELQTNPEKVTNLPDHGQDYFNNNITDTLSMMFLSLTKISYLPFFKSNELPNEQLIELNKDLINIQNMLLIYWQQEFVILQMIKTIIDDEITSVITNIDCDLNELKNIDLKNVACITNKLIEDTKQTGGTLSPELIKVILFLYFLIIISSHTFINDTESNITSNVETNPQNSNSGIVLFNPKTSKININNIIKQEENFYLQLTNIIMRVAGGNAETLKNIIDEFNDKVSYISEKVEKSCLELVNIAKDKKVFENWKELKDITKTVDDLQHIEGMINANDLYNKKEFIKNAESFVASAVSAPLTQDVVSPFKYFMSAVSNMQDLLNTKPIQSEIQNDVSAISNSKSITDKFIEVKNLIYGSQVYCLNGFKMSLTIDGSNIMLEGSSISYQQILEFIYTLNINLNKQMDELNIDESTRHILESLKQRLTILEAITEYLNLFITHSGSNDINHMNKIANSNTIKKLNKYLNNFETEFQRLSDQLETKYPNDQKKIAELKEYLKQETENLEDEKMIYNENQQLQNKIDNQKQKERADKIERVSKNINNLFYNSKVLALSGITGVIGFGMGLGTGTLNYVVDKSIDEGVYLQYAILGFLMKSPLFWTTLVTIGLAISIKIAGLEGTLRGLSNGGKSMIMITSGPFIFIYELIQTPFGYKWEPVNNLGLPRRINNNTLSSRDKFDAVDHPDWAIWNPGDRTQQIRQRTQQVVLTIQDGQRLSGRRTRFGATDPRFIPEPIPLNPNEYDGNTGNEYNLYKSKSYINNGGKLYNNTRAKKTRKNKKCKTKKLKGKNKRRHTRNKKGGRTKRR